MVTVLCWSDSSSNSVNSGWQKGEVGMQARKAAAGDVERAEGPEPSWGLPGEPWWGAEVAESRGFGQGLGCGDGGGGS